MPKCNAEGLALIKSFEGCHLNAYPDPGSERAKTGHGSGDPWTIGYGQTGSIDGKPVVEGLEITQKEADDAFADSLVKFEQEVNDLCAISINSNQFSALVSFQYNTGALGQSTLMRLVNAGNFKAAASQFAHWVYADGVVLPGLVRRRAAEAKLFLQPVSEV